MLDITKILKSGGVGILPTDTLYGIVGSALNPETVERIYKLRKRDPEKPMIILIADIRDLNLFNIELTENNKEYLQKIWPNPVSVILPCLDDKFKYLHRGGKTLAFRMPKKDDLLKLLNQTGPIVAPSANFEGDKPAETIEEARKYFGEKVEFYLDQGKLSGEPSTLIKIEKDQVKVLREGAININNP